MKPTRATQPYRAGGVRPPSQVLLNMLRGATTSGHNPQDAHRALAKMAARSSRVRRDRKLPALRKLPRL